RRFVGGALLSDQLVSDLRAVPMRDHEPRLGEQRLQRRHGPSKVRELLRRRAAFAGPHQRVPAKRYDGGAHTSAGSSRPFSPSTSLSVGSPISWSLYVTRNAGLSRSISRRRSIGVPIRTRSASERSIVSRRSSICCRPWPIAGRSVPTFGYCSEGSAILPTANRRRATRSA